MRHYAIHEMRIGLPANGTGLQSGIIIADKSPREVNLESSACVRISQLQGTGSAYSDSGGCRDEPRTVSLHSKKEIAPSSEKTSVSYADMLHDSPPELDGRVWPGKFLAFHGD